MKQKTTKRDVLITIVTVYVCFFTYFFLGRWMRGLFDNEFAGFFVSQVFLSVLAAAAAFFLKRTDLFHSDRSYLKKGWLSAGFLFFLMAIQVLVSVGKLFQITVTPAEVLLFLGQMILVGFSEEVLFRGLIQRAMHDHFGEGTLAQVLEAIILSGLLFGCTHLMNGFSSGVSFRAAGVQAMVTAFIGMYFGAIYFRTGKNIWYMIFLHAVYDMLGMIAGGRLGGTPTQSVLNMAESQSLVGMIEAAALYLCVTLFVLRPKKTEALLGKDEEQAV